MIARRSRKQIEIFNFSFLDILACTIGALIFILVMALLHSSGVIHAVQITSDIKHLDKAQAALQTKITALQGATQKTSDDLRKLESEQTTIAQEIDSYIKNIDQENQRFTQLSQEKSNQKKQITKADAQYTQAVLRFKNLQQQKKDALERPKRAVPIAEDDGKDNPGTPIHVDCRRDQIIIYGQQRVVVPIEAINAPDSPYRDLVEHVHTHPNKESIVLWVRPDGRNTFKLARKLGADKEINMGWEPADEDWQLSVNKSPLTLYAGRWMTLDEIESAKRETEQAEREARLAAEHKVEEERRKSSFEIARKLAKQEEVAKKDIGTKEISMEKNTFAEARELAEQESATRNIADIATGGSSVAGSEKIGGGEDTLAAAQKLARQEEGTRSAGGVGGAGNGGGGGGGAGMREKTFATAQELAKREEAARNASGNGTGDGSGGGNGTGQGMGKGAFAAAQELAKREEAARNAGGAGTGDGSGGGNGTGQGMGKGASKAAQELAKQEEAARNTDRGAGNGGTGDTGTGEDAFEAARKLAKQEKSARGTGTGDLGAGKVGKKGAGILERNFEAARKLAKQEETERDYVIRKAAQETHPLEQKELKKYPVEHADQNTVVQTAQAIAKRETQQREERQLAKREVKEKQRTKKPELLDGKQITPKRKKKTIKRRFKEEEKLLFNVGLKFQRDLNGKNISKELRQEFENKRIHLSRNSTVLIEDKDSRWIITDNTRSYVIRKEGDKLNVYEGD